VLQTLLQAVTRVILVFHRIPASFSGYRKLAQQVPQKHRDWAAVPERIISAAMSQPSAKKQWATSHPYRSTSRTSQCCRLPELSPRSVAVAPAPPGRIQSGASRPQTGIRWDVPSKVKVSPSATLLTVASNAGRTSAWTWVKTSRRAREKNTKKCSFLVGACFIMRR